MEPIRLSLRTPFPVGRVNCWLLRGSPLTLVDPGPRAPETLADLELGVRAAGRSLEEVELVLLTHQHVDHVGSAGALAARVGCAVGAHSLLADYLEDYDASLAAEDAFRVETMRRHGVPEATIERRRRFASGRLGASVRVERRLAAGDVVEAGGTSLRVVHRPGHSPTDTLFVDEDGRSAIVGDHLIASFASSPVLHRGGSGLVAYLESLRRTAELDVDVLHPGHGEPFGDHGRLVEQRIALHHGRAGAVARELDARPRTAYELARSVWGDLAARQPYPTLCGILGALELLVADGRARELDGGYVAA